MKIMAGLDEVSIWAEANWLLDTTQEHPGPQYTDAKAIVPAAVSETGFRPSLMLYSVILPALFAGGSHKRRAPSER